MIRVKTDISVNGQNKDNSYYIFTFNWKAKILLPRIVQWFIFYYTTTKKITKCAESKIRQFICLENAPSIMLQIQGRRLETIISVVVFGVCQIIVDVEYTRAMLLYKLMFFIQNTVFPPTNNICYHCINIIYILK